MTRLEFLDNLPKNAVIAEIGVWKGNNALNIYNICQPTRLYLIDHWKRLQWRQRGDYKRRTQQQWDQIYRDIVNEFGQYDNVEIIRQDSLEAALSFPVEYFDWIYIDAGHSYESCKSDLIHWYPKIKTGGYLCGHDYCDTKLTRKKGFKVKKAVDELLKEKKLSIEFISDVEDKNDYAIKKI